MTPQLQKKIDFALTIIRNAAEQAEKQGQLLEVAYSGGKDSDVILELTRMAGVNYQAFYKCTSIDPKGTITHAKENGVTIVPPKMPFKACIAKKGVPNRWRRHCCSVLKEYKILDNAILGVRRDESRARKERYKEPELCRVYNKTKNEKARQYLPILEWTAQDVTEFIAERGIRCHPLYYDEDGTFHVERRLGCIGCPLASRPKRLAQLKEHPSIVKLYVGGATQFLDTHSHTKTAQRFADGYQFVTFNFFCDTFDEFQEKFGKNLFDDGIDCKKFLEEYFNITL